MRMKCRLFGISGVIIVLLLSVFALTQASEVDINPEVLSEYQSLYDNPDIQKALDYIEADHDNRVAETIEIAQIPSPPFNEQERAKDFALRLEALGLEDVYIDLEGNAIGYYRGTVGEPKLLMSAHLDTVFLPGYDTTVTIDDEGWIHCPGIGDDTSGMTMVLSIIRALNEAQIKTVGDIMFVGNVGEEGRGDLRGVKYLFSNNDDIDGFISVDCDPEPDQVPYSATINALGSYRYEFWFEGPGGHSSGAFGTVSAVQAMGRAVTKISDMQVPKEPRTTFTASVVKGGTAVNAIAGDCMLMTDTRSQSPEQLVISAAELVDRVKQGVLEENQRWQYEKGGEVTVEVHLVGLRPSGLQDLDTPTIQGYLAAACVMPYFSPRIRPGAGSTDSNIPIWLGVPAITIGRGGKSKGGHALWEHWNPEGAWNNVQAGLLIAVGLVGMDSVTEPVLPDHPGYDYKFEGLPFIPEMYLVPGLDYKFSWVERIAE